MSARLTPFLAVLLAAGCITAKPTEDDEGTTDSGGGDGGGDSVSIYDIQQGLVEDGATVTLRGVQVTTQMTLSGGGFYIQEPEGGEFSGLYVYMQATMTDLYLEVGDEITINGQVTEYYDFTELTVSAEADIEVTGYGTVSPTTVTGEVTDWEPWESVLIELTDQTVEDCPDNYYETEISAGIELNDEFYEYETEAGATYDSIIGTVAYSYEEWKLNPRGADDMIGYVAGEGCTTTVADIQQTGVDGDGVELEGVVVTAGWTSSGGGFYVQDAGGGDYSGIYVYVYDGDDGTLDLEPGMVLDMTGSIAEYYDFTEVSVSGSSAITVTGETADVVTAELTEAPSDWEPYEGGLIAMTSPTATGNTDSYGQTALDYGIEINDEYVEVDANAGDTWDSVTGVVAYSYETWVVNPRSDDDLQGYTDNGGGGEVTAATVYDVQTGVVAEGTEVEITGAIVTTPNTASESGFFIQDAGGGEYSGVYVYTGEAVEVAVGDEVSIVGFTTEYYDLTEITADASDITVTGTGTVTVDTLATAPDDWEAWEGAVVQVALLNLTEEPDSNGEAATDFGGIVMDDLFWDYSSSSSWATITGAVTYTYSEYKLCPRDSDDAVGGD